MNITELIKVMQKYEKNVIKIYSKKESNKNTKRISKINCIML